MIPLPPARQGVVAIVWALKLMGNTKLRYIVRHFAVFHGNPGVAKKVTDLCSRVPESEAGAVASPPRAPSEIYENFHQGCCERRASFLVGESGESHSLSLIGPHTDPTFFCAGPSPVPGPPDSLCPPEIPLALLTTRREDEERATRKNYSIGTARRD